MANSGITGTAYNPKEDQPYNIESTLAQQVLENPANSGMAYSMLHGYQLDRENANSNYNFQLGEQRAQAQQVLQAQIANERAQRINEGIKEAAANPGVYGVLASNPNTADLYAGTDQGAVNSLNDWTSRMGVAKQLEAAGKGIQGFGAAGMQIPPGYVSSVLPGNPPITQGDSDRVATEKVRAAAGAARGGSGSGGLGWTTTLPYNVEDGTQTSIHGKGMPPARPTTSGATSLPVAKTDPGKSGGGGSSFVDLNTPENSPMRSRVLTGIETSRGKPGGVTDQQYRDIVAGTKGNLPNVVGDPNTQKKYAVGASGKHYEIQ